MFKNGFYVKGERKLVVQLGDNWIELKFASQHTDYKNFKLINIKA